MDWYQEYIEKPVREIIKNLRDNGINTICSCGHGMWIQCETYEEYHDLNTIYNVLIEMGISDYMVNVCDTVQNGHRNKHLEIMIPVNGQYYRRWEDNKDFKGNVFEKEK